MIFSHSHVELLEQYGKHEKCLQTRLLAFCTTQLSYSIHISLKVHKIEIFFGFDFDFCIISLLVMSKY
jgi:hypothetical protein